MINDFIKLERDQTAATECLELLAWIRDLRAIYERGVRIRAKMQHNFSDAGGENSIDWAALQTLWGIPVLDANSVGPTANGAIVYTFINGAVGSMTGDFQTNAAQQITERVG